MHYLISSEAAPRTESNLGLKVALRKVLSSRALRERTQRASGGKHEVRGKRDDEVEGPH
jgi:hypothetical protein